VANGYRVRTTAKNGGVYFRHFQPYIGLCAGAAKSGAAAGAELSIYAK
jgi:hypothetical protein